VLLLIALLACTGCRLMGAESNYGFSANDLNFGELGLVLEEREGSRLQSVPFFLFGQGTLPEEYGDNESFQRTSFGDKVRFPVRFKNGRIVVYAEGGAMVSYYDASSIGTPWELEIMISVGTQIKVGKGWSIDLGARARHPTGNGNDSHSDTNDDPVHAPHGTQGEFILGIKKDF